MSLGITGIDHIQIAVPKALEAKCLAFYRELFGFPELAKPPELRERGGAWFQVGALQMHIGVDPDASPKSKRHVCFRTSDLARAKRGVLEHGVLDPVYLFAAMLDRQQRLVDRQRENTIEKVVSTMPHAKAVIRHTAAAVLLQDRQARR